jgi:hypothetical protein
MIGFLLQKPKISHRKTHPCGVIFLLVTVNLFAMTEITSNAIGMPRRLENPPEPRNSRVAGVLPRKSALDKPLVEFAHASLWLGPLGQR